jgi:hypothetical protein
MANVICDGTSKECLKGEDYSDCDWCHASNIAGEQWYHRHHSLSLAPNMNGINGCSQRCYQTQK